MQNLAGPFLIAALEYDCFQRVPVLGSTAPMPGDRLQEGDGAMGSPWALELEKIRVQEGLHHF